MPGIMKYLIVLLSVFLPVSLDAQEVYYSSVEGLPADNVSVYIEDLRSGNVLLDVNGEIPMTPASVTKLFTAATVFQTSDLGATFITPVYITGKIKNGILNGDLIIASSGDPTLESRYFPEKKGFADSIVSKIKALGIKTIKGDIRIKKPKILSEAVPAGWKESDVVHPYGAGYHAFNYADNRIALTFKKDGSFTFAPITPGLKAKKGKNRNGENVWREKEGTIFYVDHNGKKPLSLEVANPLPENTFIELLKAKLKSDSIPVDGLKFSGKQKQTEIYSHASPTIYEILKSMVLRSDNQMAESMLRYAFPECSRKDAVRKETELWKDLGVDVRDMSLEDGSGLSRNNRLTAYNLADMLVWMAINGNNVLDFINMLPRAGETGTLKSFLRSTQLQGRFLAKTGSLNGVQCYAGYVVDAIGIPTHVVVLMVNGFKGNRSDIKSVLQQLLIEKIH